MSMIIPPAAFMGIERKKPVKKRKAIALRSLGAGALAKIKSMKMTKVVMYTTLRRNVSHTVPAKRTPKPVQSNYMPVVIEPATGPTP